jgi:hypothetical protein
MLGDTDAVRSPCPARADHLQLVSNEWEQLKKSFTGTTPQGASVMQLPFSLVKAMPESVHLMLQERSGYEDKLRLMDSEVAGIFDLAVNNILEVRSDRLSWRGGRGLGSSGGGAPRRHVLLAGCGAWSACSPRPPCLRRPCRWCSRW